MGAPCHRQHSLMKIVLAVQSVKPHETRAAWEPLVADLARKAGLGIGVMTASQSDTVQALASGEADLVWLSSSAAIDAVIDADAEVIALYYNINGANGYKSVIAARADSGIQSLDEALAPCKYNYAGGAPTSTSGYVLPQHFLFTPRKTTADLLFKSVASDGHFPNLAALWARKVDVIVNNTTDLAVFQARTPGAQEGIVTLWESPLVPNDVLMVRRDMQPAHRQRLAGLFMAYGETPGERELFAKASGISHFVPADNLLLDAVSGFKFATERALIEKNTALDAGQQTLQHCALDQRVRKFNAAVKRLRA